MSLKEHVVQELDRLPEAQLKQVADFLAFLKFRARQNRIPVLAENDEASLAVLYAEFADEDLELAEEGIESYAQALDAEDAQ